MTRKAERATGGQPVTRLGRGKNRQTNYPTPTTHHRKIQLFEIFDRDTLSAVIALAGEVSR